MRARTGQNRAELSTNRAGLCTNRAGLSTNRPELDTLGHQTVSELKVRYRQLFGEPSRSHHKQFLVRRIAWRLQALAEGDLSERARQRALTLAQDADLRLRAPQALPKPFPPPAAAMPKRDPRLPPPGAVLTRLFRGQMLRVEVLPKGFRYQDRVYASLSAIARHVSGVQWNGFSFFALPSRAEAMHVQR
jgi:hypothetical protein